MIFGDNIFYARGLTDFLINAGAGETDAIAFGYYVKNANACAYGAASFDESGPTASLEQKSENSSSNCSASGLYNYDGKTGDLAVDPKPVPTGDLKVTDFERNYLKKDELSVKIMAPGYACLDTGTHGSLLDAGNYIRIIEQRKRLKITCLGTAHSASQVCLVVKV